MEIEGDDVDVGSRSKREGIWREYGSRRKRVKEERIWI